MVTAMLFAGGIGARMQSSSLPKQFLEVGGKPIIVHTMEHFSAHSMVDGIVIACKEDWIDYLVELIEKFHIKYYLYAVASFSKEPDDLILICDGVRPMLSERLITDCILTTRKYGTAVPVTPSIDSLLYSTDGETCGKSYDRNQMYVTQAPQGYTMERILWAHSEAEKRGITNPISSSELFIELGERVRLFKGERFNIKVTTPEDLVTLRAQFYYENYKKFAREELKYGL